MPDSVVDASVLAAVAFGEDRMPEALEMMRGTRLFAPSLLDYELTSIALKKTRLHGADQDAITDNLNAALESRVHRMNVSHPDVLRLAKETGLTTYDASYLWLARMLGIPVLTFDGDLGRAAGALP